MTRVWAFIACWLGLAGLVGCQRTPNQPAAVPTTAITFLHYFTGSLSGGLDDMARVFNSQNTQYEIKTVSLDHEAFKTSIQDTLKSGQPPDLYAYWAGARTASLVADLEPLDDIWQQAGLDKQFPPSLVRAAMTACHAMGVSFAMDDPGDLAIVNGVIGLARSFGREVIAEGVETRSHGDMLLATGCELAQGYGIAKPMPAVNFPNWVADWHRVAAWTA